MGKANTLSYLLAIFFVILSLAAPWGNQGISSYPFIKAYIGTFGLGSIMLLLLYQARKTKQFNYPINALSVLLLSLFAWVTLSIIWSTNVDFAISKWLLWLLSLFAFIAALKITFDRKNLMILAFGLLIAATLSSTIGIFQYLFDWQVLSQSEPPSSTFGNRNRAAQLIVLTLPITLFLLPQKYKSKYSIWLISLSIASMLIFVFYAKSRAAWLAITIEALVVIFYMWHNRAHFKTWAHYDNNKRNAIIFSLLAVLIMINISHKGWQSSTKRISNNVLKATNEATSQNYARYLIWDMTLDIIKDNPIIGTGVGSYLDITIGSNYIKDFSVSGVHHAHNDLLEFLVELGLIGLILFLAMMFFALLSLKNLIKNNHKELKLFNYLILATLFGLLINMQFSFLMQLTVPIILVGFYIGLIVRQLNLNNTNKVVNFNISKTTYKAFSLLVITIITLTWLLYAQWIIVYRYINKVDSANISNLSSLILHFDMPIILNNISIHRFNDNHYQRSEPIDKKILEFWPHHANALRRYALGISSLGRAEEALNKADLLIQNSPPGLYHNMALVAKIKAYKQLKQTQNLIVAFNQLMADENALKSLLKTSDLHRFLLQVSVENEPIRKYAIKLYENYLNTRKKRKRYSCQNENNIAAYYTYKQEYNKAKQHINIVRKKEGNTKCLNQNIITFLQSKNEK